MQTRHHKIPRSRMRQKRIKDNILLLPHPIHRAWHLIFGNLDPEEARVLIDCMFDKKRKALSFKQLHNLRQEIVRREYDGIND